MTDANEEAPPLEAEEAAKRKAEEESGLRRSGAVFLDLEPAEAPTGDRRSFIPVDPAEAPATPHREVAPSRAAIRN